MKKSITIEQRANLVHWASFIGFTLTTVDSNFTNLTFEGKHSVSGCRIACYIVLSRFGKKQSTVFSKCDWQDQNEYGYSSAEHAMRYIEKSLGLGGAK